MIPTGICTVHTVDLRISAENVLKFCESFDAISKFSLDDPSRLIDWAMRELSHRIGAPLTWDAEADGSLRVFLDPKGDTHPVLLSGYHRSLVTSTLERVAEHIEEGSKILWETPAGTVAGVYFERPGCVTDVALRRLMVPDWPDKEQLEFKTSFGTPVSIDFVTAGNIADQVNLCRVFTEACYRIEEDDGTDYQGPTYDRAREAVAKGADLDVLRDILAHNLDNNSWMESQEQILVDSVAAFTERFLMEGDAS